MQSTGELILRRATGMLLAGFVLSLVVFVTFQVLPGDPALLMAGTEADPEVVESLRQRLGLDRPLPVQYWDWMTGALQGDLGTSIRYSRPVAALLAERLPVTLALTVLAAGLAVAISVPAGIAAALRRGGFFELLVMVLSQVGLSTPSFWVGILLIGLFALRLGWLPSGGLSLTAGALPALRALLLPALTLGLASGAVLARMVRSSVLEAMEEDFVRTARAKGLGERAVVFKHALKNALIPVVTVLGMHLGSMLAGSVIIEQVFSLPGMGRLLLVAVGFRDLPLVQGAALVVAGSVVFVNFLVDIAYILLDPRVRYS